MKPPDAPASIGLFGKLPARGDFVRLGLPGSFTGPWDAWLQRVLPASRAALGADWLPAWLEAPIWHFLLAPGACGPDAALGVWMPSVDRAGRHFPLTLACVAPGLTPAELLARHGGFLQAAEQAGLGALESDLPPDAVLARLVAPPGGGCAPAPAAIESSLWWTDGAPRVAPATRHHPAMPDAAEFTAMLSDRKP